MKQQFQRGSQDHDYNRPNNPHLFPNGTYKGEAVTDLTDEEIEEYNKGYNYRNLQKQV